MEENKNTNPARDMSPAEHLATRLIVDTVWKSAGIEVRGITFPQTDSIFNGTAPGGMSVKDIITVNNIKRAWQFLLSNDRRALDWQAVSQYNNIIGSGLYWDPGRIRTFDARISGTDWAPPIPGSGEPQTVIRRIMEQDMDPVDRATVLLTRIMRGQWFRDGNKRTALMAANHSLVHDGVGVLAIRQQDMTRFMDMLLDYYETGHGMKVRTWLARHAVEHLPGGLTLADSLRLKRRQPRR